MEIETETRPAILIFGPTGVGKSTLGNLISGHPGLFPVGNTLASHTSEFHLKDCYLNGDQNLPILLIDTPGKNDNRRIDGLSNPKIHEKMVSFLSKNKIRIGCILFCMKQTLRLQEDFLNELKELIRTLGDEHTRNIYVTITQLDTLNDRTKRETIQTLQRDLPGFLRQIPGLRERNILMPDETQIDNFTNSLLRILISSAAVEFKMEEIDLNKPLELMKRVDALLQLRYEDAIQRISSLPGTRNPTEIENLKEMKLLIEIARNQRGDNLCSVLSNLRGSSSQFLKDLLNYFTSDQTLNTLKGDIQAVFLTSNQNHNDESFFHKDSFVKVILGDLDQNLIPNLNSTLVQILERNLQKRAQYLRENSASFSFNQSNFYRSDSEYQSWSKTTGTLGTLGLAIRTVQTFFSTAAAVGTEAAVGAAFFTPLAIGAAVFIALGAAGYLISSILWTREGVIEDVCKQVHGAFLDQRNHESSQPLKEQLRYICLLYVLNCLEMDAEVQGQN